MTLNDHTALCFKLHSFPEPITKIWMQIDPCYRCRRCSPMTLVSGSIRFLRILAWVPWRGASNDWGISKMSIFSPSGRYMFGTLENKANSGVAQFCVLFVCTGFLLLTATRLPFQQVADDSLLYGRTLAWSNLVKRKPVEMYVRARSSVCAVPCVYLL